MSSLELINSEPDPAYQRWQKLHPDFNPADYANWIQQRGYYKSALSIHQPEFYEYAAKYLALKAAQPVG